MSEPVRCGLCRRTRPQHWRRRLCGPLTGTGPGPMTPAERERYLAATRYRHYDRKEPQVKALQDELERDGLRNQRDALLEHLERRYIEALNAIIAASPDRESDADVNRWRGHAEAYRQTCEKIRALGGLPAVPYLTEEWRLAHGAYPLDKFAR